VALSPCCSVWTVCVSDIWRFEKLFLKRQSIYDEERIFVTHRQYGQERP
jgi:hypothetical protein